MINQGNKNFKNSIEDIKNLIANGNTSEAITSIIELSKDDKEINNLAIGVSSEQSRIKEIEIRGVHTISELNVMHNTITSKILRLIEVFDEDGNIISDKKTTNISDFNNFSDNQKVGTISAGVGAFACWILEKIFGLDDKNDQTSDQISNIFIKVILVSFLFIILYVIWRISRIWVSTSSLIFKIIETFLTLSYLWLLYYFLSVYFGGAPIVM